MKACKGLYGFKKNTVVGSSVSVSGVRELRSDVS